MGTPAFSVPTLIALNEAGHDILEVYTQPPRPAGRRGLEPVRSPVHQTADRLGLAVRTPVSLKDPDEQAFLADLAPDVIVVVAYGLILPQAVLDIPRYGAFNGHASLLPRWRGAAPIQRAIMAGDRETGMMIMKMEAGLDTGPIALTRKLAISDRMTAGALHDRLMHDGAMLMVDAMRRLEHDDLPVTPQAETGVTYAAKIEKHEARIDFSRPAIEICHHIHGLSPFPGAWFAWQHGSRSERIKVLLAERRDGAGSPGTVLDEHLTIACGKQAVGLLRLQRAGGKPLDAPAFLNGLSIPSGTVIG